MIRTRLKFKDELPDEEENNVLRKQLEREIACLERQLDRLKYLEGRLDDITLRTYEDMIHSRRDMLAELS